jgi:hypothetical protein
MQREIENSISLITAGFETYKDKIKDMMCGYSLINTPIINADDIGNCYDHLEQTISLRLVPAGFVKGEIEVDKVMPYQKQQFISSLHQIAIHYRGWKTIDISQLRDLLLDYFSLQNDAQSRKQLKGIHNIEYILTSTRNYRNHSNAKMGEPGAAELREAAFGWHEDDIQMQIKQAEANGEEEKARILGNIFILNAELDMTVEHKTAQLLNRKINILRKRLSDLNSSPFVIKRFKVSNNTDAGGSPMSLKGKDIKEIFEFYAKQHLMMGKRETFDQMKQQNSTLNMGDFVLFCKDFKIP